ASVAGLETAAVGDTAASPKRETHATAPDRAVQPMHAFHQYGVHGPGQDGRPRGLGTDGYGSRVR
ncbi:MAG: hypothetical protein ACO2PN_10090, partial [Pyrobaculum sp.]